jgi:methyl-accepting chemotaxis protein
VRQLSIASRDTGKTIGAKIALINDALTSIVGANEQAVEREAAAVKDSEARIGSVLHNFGGMTERLLKSAAQFRSEGEIIKDEVMESMVQLQFQDRIDQILTHVVQSIEDLSKNAALMDASTDDEAAHGVAQEYLAGMAQRYTTEEQRRIHQGAAAVEVAPQAAEFF